jgi:hypothetical protein
MLTLYHPASKWPEIHETLAETHEKTFLQLAQSLAGGID